MRKRIMPIASLGFAAALAGCSTTDALIPRVDVGEGSFRSPPVTQADLEAMSTQTAVMPVESVPPSHTAAFSAQPHVASPPTQYAPDYADYTDPAGTLEDQASRLAKGGAPVQTLQPHTPQAQGDSPQPQEPAARERRLEAEPPATAAAEPKHAAAPSQAASAGSSGIRFLPIIGAPVEAVTPLSKQLGASARAEGLPIKASGDTTSDHILKGYFSALNDGGKTTVVYVWDILDGDGNRLHRIQGQDTVAKTAAADPWGAVPPETMQAIAEKTIAAYLEWRRSRAG